MVQYRLVISNIPTSIVDKDAALQHVRSHCTRAKVLEYTFEPGKLVLLIDFLSPQDFQQSHDRLSHARLRGVYLDVCVDHTALPAPRNNSISLEDRSSFSVVLSLLPVGFTEGQLKQHLQAHTAGLVVHITLGASNTGLCKATCKVETTLPVKEAVGKLRRSRFQDVRLDVELLNTSDSRNQNPSPGTWVTFLLSKLPITTVDALTHHVRSHTGGRVTCTQLSRTKRGGMKATCMVAALTDHQAALDRIQGARFQGRKVHVQFVRDDSTHPMVTSLPLQVSPPPGFEPLALSVNASIDAIPTAHEVPTLFPRAANRNARGFGQDISNLLNSEAQAVSTARSYTDRLSAINAGVEDQVEVIQAVSTSFSRYVTSHPSRLNRSDDDSELHAMFRRFLVKSVTAQDDEDSLIFSTVLPLTTQSTANSMSSTESLTPADILVYDEEGLDFPPPLPIGTDVVLDSICSIQDRDRVMDKLVSNIIDDDDLNIMGAVAGLSTTSVLPSEISAIAGQGIDEDSEWSVVSGHVAIDT